jgi:tetratricopeptide (TPR) repeat protein
MKEINEFDIDASARELIRKAAQLGDGDEKIMTLEEAVRIADTGHDVKLQYQAREELIEAAFWGGDTEKALVAYSWCLAQFDKYPEKFSEWLLLWRYKWIVNVIVNFPQITKEQIYEMLDEMERRYLKAGYGLRVVYYYRYRVEKFFGNKDKALRYFSRAQELSRDDLSDCAACEVDERVTFQAYCGNNELALRLAEPIFSGVHRCRSVPQRTLAGILLPLVRLGRWTEAHDYHTRGYSMISRDIIYLNYVSDHLLFLALYGNFEQARLLLEYHFHWTTKGKNQHDKYTFYRAAWFLLDLMSDAGERTIKVRLPDSFPLYQYSQNHHYEISQLKEWFENRAREIGEKFDKRSGTDQFAREMAETPALKELKRS